MTNTGKSSTKSWYRRRRYWVIAILVLLVYFCLIPSPLRVSPEIAEITVPLTPDGTPDYLTAYTTWNNERLQNPEDNGLRMIVAALGPIVLEQASLMREVPWEELPTNEKSKNWYNNQWVPFCSAMQIDPDKKPRLNYRDFHGFFSQLWKERNKERNNDEKNKKDEVDHIKEITDLYKKLTELPWKVEEQPEVARWLAEMSPVLDLIGVAARKPKWACWRWSYEPDNLLAEIVLPDVQSSRAHVWNLRLRISERLSRNDIDGAWYDTITILRIARHLAEEPIFVSFLAGIALEKQGFEAVQVMLKYTKPDKEQLKRFAEELDHLPKQNPYLGTFPFFEKMMSFDLLFHLSDSTSHSVIKDFYKTLQERAYEKNALLLSLFPVTDIIVALPYDRNIVVRRFAEKMTLIEAAAREPNPKKRRELFQIEEQKRHNSNLFNFGNCLAALPLIRFRSQWIGDYAYNEFIGAFYSCYSAMDRANAQFNLLRLMIALERYHREHEKYPESLDHLVPDFLDEIPLDVFTSRSTITYRKNETGYLLYSYGLNEKDDNGNTKSNLDIAVQH